jgi:hypothetical protein
MSDIFSDVGYICEKLHSELRNRNDEHILKMVLGKLDGLLDQCKTELTKKYGSWEKAGNPIVPLINDMDDLSPIILEKKFDLPENIRIYLCDSLAYKLKEFTEIWNED